MNRRRFLEVAGGSLVGPSLAAGVSQRDTTGSEASEGFLPDDDVASTIVTPYADLYGSNPTVDPSEWIVHRFGWRTVPSEGRGDLEKFLDVAEYEFFIDGEPVREPAGYWGDIHYSARDNQWIVRWEYATPPKSTGKHDFCVRTTFDRPLHHVKRSGEIKRWSGVVEEQSTYEVREQQEQTYSLPRFSLGSSNITNPSTLTTNERTGAESDSMNINWVPKEPTSDK